MYQNLHTDSATYTFATYPIGTQFAPIAGVYTFLIIPPEHTNKDSPTQQATFYTLLYIGIAANIKTRFTNHHKIKQALNQGMTHIGILKKSSGRNRKSIERNLLKSLNPPLNQT